MHLKLQIQCLCQLNAVCKASNHLLSMHSFTFCTAGQSSVICIGYRFEDALKGAADDETMEALDWVVSSHIRSRFSAADVSPGKVMALP